MKVVSVVGNRPQFVKSAPLSLALRARGVEEIVLHTGQHYDRALSQVFFEELGLAEPDYRLDLHTADARAMRPGIASALELERPDWTLVYGDTNSTLAGAQAAVAAQVPIAHVEAGLRSGDLTMPEERNRIEVDRLVVASPVPRRALRGDPGGRGRRRADRGGRRRDGRRIPPVRADRPQAVTYPRAALRRGHHFRPLGAGEYLVLTIHREANVEPGRLRRIISNVNGIDMQVVFPAHPRTRATIGDHGIRPAPHLHMIGPLGYLDMLALVAQARVLVTDSGGLQKEAYWLGTPCVTLRPSTEWVDTVRVGANTLVDPEDDSQLRAALADPTMPDGTAAAVRRRSRSGAHRRCPL